MAAMSVAFTLAVVVTSSLLAQADQRAIGTWRLDVAKSKYDPGPPPKSETLTITRAGKGQNVAIETVTADGEKRAAGFMGVEDGTDVPFTGSLNSDTVSTKRVDANTLEHTNKRGSKVVGTSTSVMAADGKTMTVTAKFTDAKGRPVHNVAVYVKQ
jgi:hypothetical protein